MTFTCLCCCHCKKFRLLLLPRKQICSSKIMFKKARICYKTVLVSEKVTYADKRKDAYINSEKFCFFDLRRISSSIFSKIKSLVNFVSNGLKLLPSVTIKVKLFVENSILV